MRVALTTYNNIYNDLKRKINDGIYKPGDKLPPVKELCVIYNAGDSSIRKSLEMLKRNDYIYAVNRIGLFVSESNKIDSALMPFDELLNLKEKPNKIEMISINECNPEETDIKLPGNKCVKVQRMYYANAMPVLFRIDYILQNVKNKSNFNLNQKWISEMDLIFNSHFVKRKLQFYLDDTIEIKKKMFIANNIGMFKMIKTYYTNLSCFAVSIMYVSSTDINIKYSQK